MDKKLKWDITYPISENDKKYYLENCSESLRPSFKYAEEYIDKLIDQACSSFGLPPGSRDLLRENANDKWKIRDCIIYGICRTLDRDNESITDEKEANDSIFFITKRKLRDYVANCIRYIHIDSTYPSTTLYKKTDKEFKDKLRIGFQYMAEFMDMASPNWISMTSRSSIDINAVNDAANYTKTTSITTND